MHVLASGLTSLFKSLLVTIISNIIEVTQYLHLASYVERGRCSPSPPPPLPTSINISQFPKTIDHSHVLENGFSFFLEIKWSNPASRNINVPPTSMYTNPKIFSVKQK
jgi:hypothetical protein